MRQFSSTSHFLKSRALIACAFGFLLSPLYVQSALAQTNDEPAVPAFTLPTGIVIDDLNGADEATVTQRWKELQDQMLEHELTNAQNAIWVYQLFLEKGASRYPAVAIPVCIHIAQLYRLELRNIDRAIEVYDWALARYRNHPAANGLQAERLAAVKAQEKVEQQKKDQAQAQALPQSKPPADSASEPIQKSTGIAPIKLQPQGAATITAPGVSQMAFQTALGTAFGWKPDANRRVTAVAKDQTGYLWVATDETGVWRYDLSTSVPATEKPLKPLNIGAIGAPNGIIPPAEQGNPASVWKQFISRDGLADDAVYSIAVDGQNRVWVGTLNHGVSVWNGQQWRNYGVMEGPLGERVFDIVVCPTDGDVWLATNAGLTRYSPRDDRWSYFTRAQGLPSDQVNSIAFDAQGNLLVGTQCDGVAIAQRATNYANWQAVKNLHTELLVTPTGTGLPSNLVNDVLVARDGTYYAGTTCGLAWSRDAGKNWHYVRGRDYGLKVKGLNGGAPNDWKELSGALLAEDYVSCLAEDGQGRLWLGHWLSGNEVLEMQPEFAGSLFGPKRIWKREESGLVRSITFADDKTPLLARYDVGLTLSVLMKEETSSQNVAAAEPKQVDTSITSHFPTPAPPISGEQLESWISLVGNTRHPLKSGEGLFLDEDWRTGGDWMGRYGRQRAMLCGAQSPLDNNFGYDPAFKIEGLTGPNASPDEALRRWVHWEKTQQTRSLYNPVEGYRRQSEWDDHGEVYPMTQDGPHIWAQITVPAGLHRLSLYFVNKDGDTSINRNRDYLVELKKGEAASALLAEKLPTQAQTRVVDFNAGVYKRFAVQGPGKFWVKIGRNGSFNTIISGLFLDKIVAQKTLYDTLPLSWMSNVNYEIPGASDTDVEELSRNSEIVRRSTMLWNAGLSVGSDALNAPMVEFEKVPADSDCWHAPISPTLSQSRLLAMRILQKSASEEKPTDSAVTGLATLISTNAKPQLDADTLLRRWRWLSCYWTESDRSEWREVTERAYGFIDRSRAPGPPMTEKEKQQLLEIMQQMKNEATQKESTGAVPNGAPQAK